jgi:hypothetical protein
VGGEEDFHTKRVGWKKYNNLFKVTSFESKPYSPHKEHFFFPRQNTFPTKKA